MPPQAKHRRWAAIVLVGVSVMTGVGGRVLQHSLHSGKVNPEAPRWTTRLMLGRALPDSTPRAPWMSALEQSIRKFVEEPTKSVIKPELGSSLDSLCEGYDFYNLYLWEVGFGIRYGKSRFNAEKTTKSMKEIV